MAMFHSGRGEGWGFGGCAFLLARLIYLASEGAEWGNDLRGLIARCAARLRGARPVSGKEELGDDLA